MDNRLARMSAKSLVRVSCGTEYFFHNKMVRWTNGMPQTFKMDLSSVERYRFESCPDYKFLIHFNMKKILIILSLSFMVLSCGNHKFHVNKSTIIDSSLIDTPVNDNEARDYLNDTIK